MLFWMYQVLASVKFLFFFKKVEGSLVSLKLLHNGVNILDNIEC